MEKPIQFASTVRRLKQLLDVHYIEIPVSVMKKLGKIKKRLLCSVNKEKAFQCGIVNLGEGKGYITLNKKRLKDFQLINGSKIKVTLSIDESEFGMEVPVELQALLDQDKEGNRRFMKLSKGKQRYIIYYVGQVKNSQLRIDRAIMLIENLKRSQEGKENFRQMLGLE